MTAGNENSNENSSENEKRKVIEDSWAIRPCMIYKEEYSDCTSFKARFHQYFIHGETSDCSQWERDYNNCLRYEEDNNDVEAGQAIIKSEEERRNARLKAHYNNDVWKKRSAPPTDWDKALPEWLAKRNENTFLELKSKELNGAIPASTDEKSFCTIM